MRVPLAAAQGVRGAGAWAAAALHSCTRGSAAWSRRRRSCARRGRSPWHPLEPLQQACESNVSAAICTPACFYLRAPAQLGGCVLAGPRARSPPPPARGVPSSGNRPEVPSKERCAAPWLGARRCQAAVAPKPPRVVCSTAAPGHRPHPHPHRRVPQGGGGLPTSLEAPPPTRPSAIPGAALGVGFRCRARQGDGVHLARRCPRARRERGMCVRRSCPETP